MVGLAQRRLTQGCTAASLGRRQAAEWSMETCIADLLLTERPAPQPVCGQEERARQRVRSGTSLEGPRPCSTREASMGMTIQGAEHSS